MRFQILMNDTNSNLGDYQYLFAYKVTAFSHISRADRLRLIDHFINHCQANIFHLQAEAEDMVVKAAQMDDLRRKSPELAHGFSRLDTYSIEKIVNVLQHSTDIWKLQLEWARELKAKEMALASQTGADAQDMMDSE